MLRSWVFCHLAADMLTAIRTIMLVSGDLTYFVHPFCLLVFFFISIDLETGRLLSFTSGSESKNQPTEISLSNATNL